MRTRFLSLVLCLAAPLAVRPAHSQDRPPNGSGDLTTLSLEDLMRVDVSVTSAARRSQRLTDVASAVYVLTADDIRRSGVRSIPDALRLVPGMQVAQMDANKWSVSSRGFSGRFSNKLLVLIDGRTIYTPLFSGVIWELHQALPEDIERIAVVRGPGASRGDRTPSTASSTSSQRARPRRRAAWRRPGPARMTAASARCDGAASSATAPITAARSRARTARHSPATTKAPRRRA